MKSQLRPIRNKDRFKALPLIDRVRLLRSEADADRAAAEDDWQKTETDTYNAGFHSGRLDVFEDLVRLLDAVLEEGQ